MMHVFDYSTDTKASCLEGVVRIIIKYVPTINLTVCSCPYSVAGNKLAPNTLLCNMVPVRIVAHD